MIDYEGMVERIIEREKIRADFVLDVPLRFTDDQPIIVKRLKNRPPKTNSSLIFKISDELGLPLKQ